MEKSFICIDYSGSTGGNNKYWNYVENLLEKNTSSSIILWDDRAKQVDLETAMHIVKNKKGNAGTAPQCLIPLLPEKSNVILITDGQISSNNVSKCDSLLADREFESVEMHFVPTGGPMDLSVVAPFTRKTAYTIYKDGGLLSTGSTKELMDLSEYYDNPQKFLDCSEKLLHQVTVATMGRPNISLRNSILNLQENLLRCISNTKSENSDFITLRQLLTEGKYEEGLASIKQIITSTTGDDSAKQVDRLVQMLINQCANPRNFDFSLLEPSRLQRAEIVQEVVGEDLPEVKDYTGSYECPIFFDVDLPCCLINKGPAVLEGLDNGYLNRLMVNPLLVLEDADLKAKLVSRFDHVFGLDAVNMLFKSHLLKSPITRKEISCVLTFGMDKPHRKSTKYTIANLFFGQKLAGSIDMWLAVVYFVMADVEYLASNSAFMAQFANHLTERLKRNNTRMTLTGLPIDPMMRCPFDIAIWHCVTSPLTMNPNSICNRLREFGGSAIYLTRLLDILGYPYDCDFTLNRIKFYNVFNWMMRQENDNNSQWRASIRSIYQNSMKLSDGTIILLDGPATQAHLPEICNQCTPRELIALSKLVDRTKRKEFINIPLVLDSEIPQCVYNYGYKQDIPEHKVYIHPNTLRPYSYDKTNGLPWQDSSVIVFGPLDSLLSGNAYFIRYVQEKHCYPTKESLIKYMAKKQMCKIVPKDTLPAQVVEFVDSIFERYAEVLGENFENISPDDFATTTEITTHRKHRLLMEQADNLVNLEYY